MDIREQLFELQDEKYRAFHCKLIPNVEPDAVIGIRTPILRGFAKEIAGSAEAESFLTQLPHQYYEENNLHAFLLEQIKEFDRCIEAVNRFLPYVDNWATCDSMRPKVFQKHTDRLLPYIRQWMASEDVYAVRFGIEMLMCYYLDNAFRPEYAEWVAAVESEEYYIKMMVAWYFATALAKQYEAVLPFLEEYRLEPWIHNKTIQKAIESYRVTDSHKAYLRTLRRKNKDIP